MNYQKIKFVKAVILALLAGSSFVVAEDRSMQLQNEDEIFNQQMKQRMENEQFRVQNRNANQASESGEKWQKQEQIEEKNQLKMKEKNENSFKNSRQSGNNQGFGALGNGSGARGKSR